MEFTDLKTQYKLIKSEINNAINDVLDHGRYILGPEVDEMEQMLQKYTSSEFCISVASGTEALLISLMSIGLEPGDEVITTPYTWVSTAEVIVLLGATPIFADVELSTGNLDHEKLEDLITSKTKAIIPVSLYGQTCNMEIINDIAKKNNLIVIEDGAQSFGAEFKHNKSCNLSDIGCTSFFPSKPLGCYGDGGAIFTNDQKIATACREIRVHGQESRHNYTRIGVGGRMDTIQCAIVKEKLKIFDQELKMRDEIAKNYTEALGILDPNIIKPPDLQDERSSACAQYSVVVDDREKFINQFKRNEIPYAIHYPDVLYSSPAYKRYRPLKPCISAEFLSDHILCLPMSPYLKSTDQDKIIQTLYSIAASN